MALSKGTFHRDIRQPTGSQLVTGAQWNAFGWLMGHPTAAEKCRARKLGCVVGVSDTIIFINGNQNNAKTMNELNLKPIYLLNIDNWIKANKLHLNIDKTCYSVFSPKKIPVQI